MTTCNLLLQHTEKQEKHGTWKSLHMKNCSISVQMWEDVTENVYKQVHPEILYLVLLGMKNMLESALFAKKKIDKYVNVWEN